MLCKEKAREIVNNSALAGAAFAFIPIHGHSLILAGFEAGLGLKIAAIYGIELKLWSIVSKFILKKVLIVAGVGVGAKALATASMEFFVYIPVLGWLAKSVIAGLTIKGLGEAAIIVFEEIFPNKQSNSQENINDVLEEIFLACVDYSNLDELKEVLDSSQNDLKKWGADPDTILKNVTENLK